MTARAVPVLTAVAGRSESALAAGLEQHADRVVVVRRCADLADLLATAATGQARAAVVSADLRQLDADALTRLAVHGVGVVGLVDPGDEPARRRLHQLGVDQVLPVGAAADQVADALVTVADAVEQAARAPAQDQAGRWPATSPWVPSAAPPNAEPNAEPNTEPAAAPTRRDTGPRATGTTATAASFGDPRAALARPQQPDQPAAPSPGSGKVIVVWGPAGAPGRTTTAVTLAAELAAAEGSLLVDADTYAASVAQVLGLLDEAPGLASAARAADHGTLDLEQLSRLAPHVSGGLRVLTGIASATRWPELRPAALATVLGLARRLVPWTVVDVASCLEQDEELSYDTAAPRRNGAALAALAQADVVLAVGSADPVGLHRLVRGLHDLAAVCDARPVVVVNRVRASAVGSRPGEKVRLALERYAGVTDPVLVPDDAAALDQVLLQGRTLAEAARSSAARQAMVALVERVGGPAPASRPRPVRGRWGLVRAGGRRGA